MEKTNSEQAAEAEERLFLCRMVQQAKFISVSKQRDWDLVLLDQTTSHAVVKMRKNVGIKKKKQEGLRKEIQKTMKQVQTVGNFFAHIVDVVRL